MMKIDSEKLDRIIEYLQMHDHVECDPYPVSDAVLLPNRQ